MSMSPSVAAPFTDKCTSNELCLDNPAAFFFAPADSTCAILSLQPRKISGMAIFCTGVGPSVNWSGFDVNASTRSVRSPSLDHSSTPLLLSESIAEGRESSKAFRGAEKGSDDDDGDEDDCEDLDSCGLTLAGVEAVVE